MHDLKAKMKSNIMEEVFLANSPHNVLKHLDTSISKATYNVTNNPQMEETLFQISKDLVSSILLKLEMQDKITRITKEALEASGKNKGISAIETRRILDYISRALSGNILRIITDSTEPELHHLVYGLCQIAAETSIISALKDTTFVNTMTKKQFVDISLRRKRSVYNESNGKETHLIKKTSTEVPSVYNIILNKTKTEKRLPLQNSIAIPKSPYSVMSKNQRKFLQVINNKNNDNVSLSIYPKNVFLNKTVLDIENNSTAVLLDKVLNTSTSVQSFTLDNLEPNAPELMDDLIDNGDQIYKQVLSPEFVADMDVETDDGEQIKNEKKAKQKLERLEAKAKKAILYAGDVAYLAASSVVAMRRALTASIEVGMSVKLARYSMSNHQELLMNLAKTAAQQVGKEARSAATKSLACEKVMKLATKYTAQSYGAKLNHVANRIIMDTLPLSTLAKSMAFVSSDIAINSLYLATDVKPPS